MANKYDSEICGSLPVHHINLIQPYGYLIALNNKEELLIVQVSENLPELFQITAEELVNTPLYNYISIDGGLSLQNKISDHVQDRVPFSLTLKQTTGEKELIAILHTKPGYLLLELEIAPEQEPAFMDVYQEVKHSMNVINRQQSPEDTYAAGAKELKRLSGYDSVIIYQFDEEWNGSVIAEAAGEEMTSYMGLKFPASDVPKQVRNLYLKNPYRMIPDRSHIPVKLYPVINPIIQTLTDLSDCNLRSVPSVHLEYMKNMGLESSMSIGILIRNSLWGLISFHHKELKHPGFEWRAALELVSDIFSHKISAELNKVEYDSLSRLNEQRHLITDYIYTEDNWVESLVKHETNLLSLFNLDGVAVIYRGKIRTLGTVPVKDDIENLIYWLQAKEIREVYAVTNLSSINDYAAEYADIGSGLLVIPINTKDGDFIVGLRQEVVRNVNWGGNPDEALVFEPGSKNYHPRDSFRIWKQTVQKTSLPWSQAEMQVAESFRNNLFEHILKQFL